MVTSNNFLQKQNDRTNNYLEDLWSEIVVTFILRKRKTIEYKTQLTTKASIPEYIYRYMDSQKQLKLCRFPQRTCKLMRLKVVI